MSVIDKLRNDEEYYNGVGKKYLSNSDISSLLKNPKTFGFKSESNKNFLFGSYFHQLILEPEKAENVPYVDVKSRNSKAYKDYLQENGLDLALLEDEKLQAEHLVDTIKGNIDFFDMIYHIENEFEVPAVGEIAGAMWKGKADIVGKDYLYDLKTTSDIDRFIWSVRDYNYDSQAYIYQQLFGKPLAFLVIDKQTKMMGMYTVGEKSLERGREKVERAVEVYNNFFSEEATQRIDQFYYQDEV
jgi:hypothetical protein